MGYLRIIYAHFLSDGRKGTRYNKSGLTRLPELFLIVMKNLNSPLFYVQQFTENAFTAGLLLLNREQYNLKSSTGEEMVLSKEPGSARVPL